MSFVRVGGSRSRRRNESGSSWRPVVQRRFTPSPKRPRPQRSNSSVMAWCRLICVGVCVFCGIVTGLVLLGSDADVSKMSKATDTVFYARQSQAQLLRANGEVAQFHINRALEDLTDESQSAEPSREFVSAVTSAANSSAAFAAVSGSSVAGQISEDAVDMGIEGSRCFGAEVSCLDTVDAVAARAQEHHAQVTVDNTAGKSAGGVMIIVILPIVALVAASIVLARRTRRILNIGVVVALIAAIAGAYCCRQIVTAVDNAQQHTNRTMTVRLADGLVSLERVNVAFNNERLERGTSADVDHAVTELAAIDLGMNTSAHTQQLQLSHDGYVRDPDPVKAARVLDYITELRGEITSSLETNAEESREVLRESGSSTVRFAIGLGVCVVISVVASTLGFNHALRRYQ